MLDFRLLRQKCVVHEKEAVTISLLEEIFEEKERKKKEKKKPTYFRLLRSHENEKQECYELHDLYRELSVINDCRCGSAGCQFRGFSRTGITLDSRSLAILLFIT